MRSTIKHIILIVLILTSKVAIGQRIDTIYQNIITDFYNKHLNDKLFEHECTNLKFNKSFGVAVNTDSTLWILEPFIIDKLFDISLLTEITIDSADWDWLISQTSFRNLKINFSQFPNFEKTTQTEAQNDHTSKKYLIRFSSPYLWDNYAYVELWAKFTYFSSGIRILYKIDHNGKIVDFKKYNLCDDIG